MELLQFSLLLLVAQFTPGPDFALITRSSLIYGPRYGAYCALGIGSALFIHCSVICLGGAYLLSRNENLTRGILAVSAIWILYLSWKSWPRPQKQTNETQEADFTLPGKKSIYIQAVVTNLLNPKCFLFLAALAAPLLAPGQPPHTIPFIFLIAVGQAIVFWTIWSYALRLGPLEKRLVRHAKLIDRFFSILFALFALAILYEVILGGFTGKN